jgi:hypothetical protein
LSGFGGSTPKGGAGLNGGASMPHVVLLIHDFVTGIVFGNGWLAFGGVVLVGLLTFLVRRSRGIRV